MGRKSQRRGKDFETRAAKRLGTERQPRQWFEPAPDFKRIPLPCGAPMVIEAKYRATLPKTLTKYMTQAAGYANPGDVVAVLLGAPRTEPIVCLPLADFEIATGLKSGAAQLALTPPEDTSGALERVRVALAEAILLAGEDQDLADRLDMMRLGVQTEVERRQRGVKP